MHTYVHACMYARMYAYPHARGRKAVLLSQEPSRALDTAKDTYSAEQPSCAGHASTACLEHIGVRKESLGAHVQQHGQQPKRAAAGRGTAREPRTSTAHGKAASKDHGVPLPIYNEAPAPAHS
jgi:hypothetical protein